MTRHEESTEIILFVRGSGDDIVGWDRKKIIVALTRETDVDFETADAISREVEEQIIKSGINTVTAPLIRELVDSRLLERGLEKAWRMHSRIGFPLYDVDGIIMSPNRENANIPHSPEATSLTLAEGIKKNYALERVFSQKVGEAHLSGDIHIHNMGFIDRAYSSYQSLEYLKRFGLNLPHSPSAAKPAKHPEVLLAHMVRFAAALQTQFSGSIGWDSVNVSFAPFTEGMPDREVKQFAQMLIFEFSQQAVARGGQAIFTYLSLDIEVPAYLAGCDAVGPGGAPTGSKYAEYASEARRLFSAILDVYMEGDGSGRPFFFPIPIVRVTTGLFKGSEIDQLLLEAASLAAEKGNPIFVLERGNGILVPDCGRMEFSERDGSAPWKIRYASMQNVTINLPRLSYYAEGSDKRLFELIGGAIETAIHAHLEKRVFMERLLSLGENGPLSLLTMKLDGSHYLRLDRTSYLVGLVGLNEMVKAHTGSEIHETPEAASFGLKVTGFISERLRELSKVNGMTFNLNQTPAESTSYRFARLDLRYVPARAGRYVKGDISSGEIYYTNSTHLAPSAPLGPLEKVKAEGAFHPHIDSNPLTHVWCVGDSSAGKISDIIKGAMMESENSQVVFTPDFTVCLDCKSVAKGLLEGCPSCGSSQIDGISRITNYMSRLSSWNKGKIGELRDRHRTNC